MNHTEYILYCCGSVVYSAQVVRSIIEDVVAHILTAVALFIESNEIAYRCTHQITGNCMDALALDYVVFEKYHII